ncbi:MAG: coenzyme F420-0:L-glutamate ligase [Candidatus Asgardarchaeia archaeon]
MHYSVWTLVLPGIYPYVELGELICNYANKEGITLENNDIIVISAKIISKSKGAIVKEHEISPRFCSKVFSKLTGKSAIELEIMKKHASTTLFYDKVSEKDLAQDPITVAYRSNEKLLRDILKNNNPIFFIKDVNGHILPDGGVSKSNIQHGWAYNPPELDAIAKEIRTSIFNACGADVGVVIADTTMRLFRRGTIGIAVGLSGLRALENKFGGPDRYGKPKFGGLRAIGDLLASAGILFMGDTNENTPVVIIRGLRVRGVGQAKHLINTNLKWRRKLLKYVLQSFWLKLFRR